jgi:ribosomal protein S16
VLKIRLKRMGSRQDPFYRVVVSDSRRTPQVVSLRVWAHNPATNRDGPTDVAKPTWIEGLILRRLGAQPALKAKSAQA